MISQNDINTILSGRSTVMDSNGTKIGAAGQVYLDDQTGDPSWVTVKTGLFGTSESFAPLQGAHLNGDDVTVGYTKEQVKNAPRIDVDGNLSPEEEDTLYRHYSLTAPGDKGQKQNVVDDTTGTTGTVGHDTSGPTTDNAMTRSEEQLRVGVETREAGKVRLRKYIVTENVTKTVPVRREEVRLVSEPITNANRGDAMNGPTISEEVHEVVLHEEKVIVEKEAVAVERIRLDTETVTSQETVTEQVRKEKIEIIDETTNTKNKR